MKSKIAILSILVTANLFAVDNVTLTKAVSKIVSDINTVKAEHQSVTSDIDKLKQENNELKMYTKTLNDKLVLTQEELSKTKADLDAKTQGLRDEAGNLVGASNAANEKRIQSIKERLFKIEASLNGGSSADISSEDVEKKILDYIK